MGMSGSVLGKSHMTFYFLPTSHNGQGLTNGCAEAWGGTERDGEGEVGSGCM